MHLIAGAVLQAFDAQLMPVLHQRLRVLAVDGNELGDIALRARQVLGELQAQARRRRFAVGLIVDYAEAVLGSELVVGFLCSLAAGEIDAHFQRVDCRTPIGPPLQRLSEHEKGAGFLRRVLGQFVAAIGRTGGVYRQVVALRAFVGIGLDGEKRFGKPRPGGAVLVVAGYCVGQ